MHELVRQHASDLVPVEMVDETSGDGDCSVAGVAAGGEGVWLLFGGDVELRHRHVGFGGELFHDFVIARIF